MERCREGRRKNGEVKRGKTGSGEKLCFIGFGGCTPLSTSSPQKKSTDLVYDPAVRCTRQYMVSVRVDREEATSRREVLFLAVRTDTNERTGGTTVQSEVGHLATGVVDTPLCQLHSHVK